MNTYLFIETTRKSPPRLLHMVQSNSPEDAIKQVNYYPYNFEHDFLDEDELDTKDEQEKIDTVFGYYGLIEGTNPWDYGNGDDGYGTILVEVSNNGVTGQIMGYTSPDQEIVTLSGH